MVLKHVGVYNVINIYL